MKNQVVVISGGTSGIGKELVKHYLADGHVVHAFGKGKATKTLRDQLCDKTSFSDNLHLYSCDISNRNAIYDLVKEIGRQEEYIDVLINNAGYATYETFSQISINDALEIANVNFNGHLAVTLAFRTLLFRSQKPHIVFVCSIASRLPITPNSIYGASKSGLDKLADLLRLELRHLGVSITTVYPGRLETEFFDHPTFQNRDVGRETKLIGNVERSCWLIFRGIMLRKKEIFVPRYWSIVSSLYAIDNLVSKPFFRWLILKRLSRVFKK